MKEKAGAKASLCFIYTTFANLEDAERVGGELVERRLAACANIFPSMISIYEWAGKLEHSNEVAVLLKTTPQMRAVLMRALEKMHPYETPAVIAIDAADVTNAYLTWVETQTTQSIQKS